MPTARGSRWVALDGKWRQAATCQSVPSFLLNRYLLSSFGLLLRVNFWVLIRRLGSLRRREGSGVLQEERGVCTSQGGGKDKHLFFFNSTLLSLSHIKHFFFFFKPGTDDYTIPPQLKLCQLSSVAQSCPTLSDSIECSNPASLSISNCQTTLKLMSIESVIPSNHFILCVPFSSCLQSFPAAGSFQMSQFFASCGQSVRVSASALVLPMNIQD